MGRFLATIFYLISEYYIFLETSDKIKFNEDDPNHYYHHQDPLNDKVFFSEHPNYFWKSQAKSSSMKMTPTIIINTPQPFPEIHSNFLAIAS